MSAPVTVSLTAQCVDYSKDPAGCQPSTFKTPIGQMPSVRVNRDGKLDNSSSEADARAGAAKLEKGTPPLSKFRATALGAHRAIRKRSSHRRLEGRRSRRGGRWARAGRYRRQLHLHRAWQWRRQDTGDQNFQDPSGSRRKQPPVQVGEIPDRRQSRIRRPRASRSLVYKTSTRRGPLHLVRNAGTNTIGRMETYRIDMNTCLPTSQERDHRLRRPVARVLPVARSGELQSRAGLHDELDLRLAGPRSSRLETSRPDRAGSHRRRHRRDSAQSPTLARFRPCRKWAARRSTRSPTPRDYSPTAAFSISATTRIGPAAAATSRTTNKIGCTRISVLDDGERVYVAGTTAGFYVLDSEAIAHHKDAELAAGTAGCNQRSTIVLANGVIDAAKLPRSPTTACTW